MKCTELQILGILSAPGKLRPSEFGVAAFALSPVKDKDLGFGSAFTADPDHASYRVSLRADNGSAFLVALAFLLMFFDFARGILHPAIPAEDFFSHWVRMPSMAYKDMNLANIPSGGMQDHTSLIRQVIIILGERRSRYRDFIRGEQDGKKSKEENQNAEESNKDQQESALRATFMSMV